MQGFLWEVLGNIFHIRTLLLMNLGVFLGIVFGAIPGLSGNLGIILLLPFTTAMELGEAILFLTSIFCGGEFGGSISAILINTPGTNSATCTMIEGYPMAKRGNARKALMTALTASFCGGTLSAIALLCFAPMIAHFTLSFGPPEYFAMSFFGLSIIASLCGKSLAKGIVAGAIGVALSLVGMDSITGSTRFTFGEVEFLRGLTLIAILSGLFAIPNIIDKIHKAGGGEKEREIIGMSKDDRLTWAEFFRLKWIILKSSLIGIVVGAIPGAGAGIASFISYNEAKRTSKEPEKFGTGVLEGIAAPEAANNGVTSASLIPLLTLGIPGSPSAAAMIGAFSLHGMALGPTLFRNNAGIMYTIMTGLILVNVFMLVQGKFLSGFCAKITKVPDTVLAAILVVVCVGGAYSVNNSALDARVFVVFGIFAYLLSLVKIPTVPIVLGFVLGNMVDYNLRRGLTMCGNNLLTFVTRPITLVILLLTAAFLAANLMQERKEKARNLKEMGDDN